MFFVFAGFLKGTGVNQSKPVFHINKTQGAIKIDGHINEKTWEEAQVVELKYEIMPGENIPPEVKTLCYLLYNENTLFVAFKAYDPHPEKIRAHLSDRDKFSKEDAVAIVIDTFNDQNRAYGFFSNALGIQIDEVFSDGGNVEDNSWDSIWNSAGRITPEGYEVEIAIPFRSLQFQRSKKNQVWGCTLLRLYPRDQFIQITNFPHNRSNSCLVCQFPTLEGIENVNPGLNIELDPTVTGFNTITKPVLSGSAGDTKKSDLEYGISGHWGFTPNLTLSGTVNPDFSQVEADIVQLDINKQFALSYQEKRPFFLEGKDFFTTLINAVYTRSVADPEWGMKISGKEGKNAIGLFVSQDNQTNFIFPGAQGSKPGYSTDYNTSSVLRYRRHIGRSSTVGVLYSDRESGDYFNRLGGIDGLLRFSKSDSLRFQALGSSTHYSKDIASKYAQKEDTITGYSTSIIYQRQTRAYGWGAKYEDFSPEFRADLGFVPQVDYRKGTTSAYYAIWGKKNSLFPHIRFDGELSQTWQHNGNLLEKNAELFVEIEMPLQTLMQFTFGTQKKIYNMTPFNLDYMGGYFRINPSGTILFNCRFNLGDEIDYANTRPGKWFYIRPLLTIKAGKHFSSTLSYSFSRLGVERGRLYRTHVIEGNFLYHFNKQAFFRAIIQYTDIARNPDLYDKPVDPGYKKFFSQLLFSYKLNPRTVFFLGYSDNYLGNWLVPLSQTNRTLFLKLGYALSL